MIDVEFATACDRATTYFDLIKYYGLLPHIGVNIHSCIIVESLSDWLKCLKKDSIVVVYGVKKNGWFWIKDSSQEREWVKLLKQVMKDFERMQVNKVRRQRKMYEEIQWNCRL
jgi:hypothetical protein